MRRKVVITGLGAVTPLANTAPESWAALLLRGSGVRSYIDDPVLKNKSKLNVALVKDFDYRKWRVPHAGSRLNSFLWTATDQALVSSKVDLSVLDLTRSGICLGALASSHTTLLEHIEQSVQENYRNINRLSMLHVLTNIPSATLNVKYKFKGPTLTVSTACASGLSAIIEAAKWIQFGEADLVIAGGTEDIYNPLYIQSSLRLQAMSTHQYDTPEESSRPFDKRRSGFIPGEGCGILILESQQHALARNARILAELVGYGYTSDGYHLVRPEATGEGQMRAMQQAVAMAGITPSQVDHISCHATSTQKGDEIEANAIKSLFGEKPIVSAVKSSIGHAFAAAGAIETVFAIQSLLTNTVPGILNLQEPDVTGVNYALRNVKQEIRTVLKNSFGFGGVNVSALFRRYF